MAGKSLPDMVAELLRSEGKPMRSKDISKKLLDSGLWKTEGKTPEATVASRLYTDIRKKGDESVFVQTGKNTFALNPDVSTPPPAEAKSATVADSGAPKADEAASSPQAPSGVVKRLTFTDAAEDVLKRHSGGKPMHYRAITEQAIADGLIQSEGQTPWATLNSQVLIENQRAARQDKAPRFVRHGGGLIGLADWEPLGAQAGLAQHNAEVEAALLKEVRELEPEAFEQLIGELLRAMGIYDVEVTQYTGDGGVDARGRHELALGLSVAVAVQAKRWKANVRKPAVQQLRGAISPNEQGLIITTSDFSKGARDEASRSDKPLVWLLNGPELVRLLIAHDIGARRVSLDYFEVTGLDLGDDCAESE